MNTLFVITPHDVFGLILLGLLAISLIIFGLIRWYNMFVAWRRTGYCRHNFEMENSTLYGARNWHRCTKCKSRRYK